MGDVFGDRLAWGKDRVGWGFRYEGRPGRGCLGKEWIVPRATVYCPLSIGSSHGLKIADLG